MKWIRDRVAAGRYYFTDHALTKHPLAEGFRPRDALEAITRGSIIERRDEECRCLVCGDVPGLRLTRDYIANYIHCSIRWDDLTQVVIITMYRPASSEWVNHFRRRKSASAKEST